MHIVFKTKALRGESHTLKIIRQNIELHISKTMFITPYKFHLEMSES